MEFNKNSRIIFFLFINEISLALRPTLVLVLCLGLRIASFNYCPFIFHRSDSLCGEGYNSRQQANVSSKGYQRWVTCWLGLKSLMSVPFRLLLQLPFGTLIFSLEPFTVWETLLRQRIIPRVSQPMNVNEGRFVFWNSIHLEVASDSFCFLINSSWLLVFILILFSLFFSYVNLYWWKGIHFS